ncbi:MAG: hydantoinase/oxoprolinase family protein [Acidobacteriota bacterium]|nr:MAG: hydantoinase/oxoprolinase family protein [Acidobacteriota bacterium]
MKRIGIDIGGTFTDLVYRDDEQQSLESLKLPSTPDDPSRAALSGIRTLCEQAGSEPEAIDLLFHGTTVATNILLEGKGARVGMVTTRGFRDLLHIGRKDRPFNFSNYQDIPRQSRPLVKRRHRLTVKERVTANGNVETPLDEADVREAAERLEEAGVEAVAIGCLFSFLEPSHEKRIAEILREAMPEVFITASHEVVPLHREYERFSTTALNAYLGPKTARYVETFAAGVRALGIRGQLHLMTSAGGVVAAEEAKRLPVSLLLSGPVAALIEGIACGARAGEPSVITLDVGGTSADIGVAPRGELRRKHLLDTRIGDYDAMVPMIDLDTIGAGGGSIAYIDTGGMFRVGPKSAGADPGPACYGLGGEEATVTDALVTLGWFRPEALAVSGVEIQPANARRAVEKAIAKPLNMTTEEAAMGVFRIAANNMMEAIRVNSVSKGYDPREFALVAFGGAGAAFAATLARDLSIPRVLVPLRPGVGAASGLLHTELKYEQARSLWQDLSRPDVETLQTNLDELSEHVRAELRGDGIEDDAIEVEVLADCRYAGQGYELLVPAHGERVDEAWVSRVIEAFHRAHERQYLRRFEDRSVQLIGLRTVSVSRVPHVDLPEASVAAEAVPPVMLRRQAWFLDGEELRPWETPFYRRDQLGAGHRLEGPAIIEQSDTTTVLPPRAKLEVDRFGHLVMEYAGDQRP